MQAFRLRAHLFAVVMIVALSSCGSAAIPEVPMVGVSRIIDAGASTTVLPKRKSNTISHPMRLIIPSVAIDAPVEEVGTQANADLATPTQNPWQDVGWYDQGPQPGERGSAVMDGHLDRPGGFPAVFWRLRDMHVGDEVLVRNSLGETIRFRVTRIELFPPQDAPIQDIFGNWGGTYLNLITCAGDWIPSQHQTNLRLVVYTSLVVK
ncbi:MAG TPA: class F sortase [Ktedonobacteraceae bacterium]|nr:class F sortase [Ktedonobacteraceae bacterium]